MLLLFAVTAVMKFIFAYTDVILADAVGCGPVMVVPLFAVIPGSRTSCPDSASIMVMLLLFAPTVVIAYMFSISSASCLIAEIISFIFAYTVVMEFIINRVRGCTSGNDFTNIRDSSWIALGF
jgi:ABC-type uncharacterized transport system permease subunit